jgi:methylated-DNA-protein-cysteine methyltransferase related protein
MPLPQTPNPTPPTPDEAVFRFVRTIPAGRVVSYGQVAEMVEEVSVSARQVGGIMAFCAEDVPWHRVVGADGRLLIAKRDPSLGALQRKLLEREGVAFLDDGRVDMARFQWGGEDEEPRLDL